MPTGAALLGEGGSMILPASHSILGRGSGGTPGQDVRTNLGRLSGRDPATNLPSEIQGVSERIGTATREDTSLYTLFRPMAQGFASLNFRPQLTLHGYPNFEHNPQMPRSMYRLDEQARPQVLTMRAYGAQSSSDSDWRYVQNPDQSRARGGTADGGILLAPPRFELSDYYGIGGDVMDVTDTTSSVATSHHVLHAPGVRAAFGLPTVGGSVQPGGSSTGYSGPTKPQITSIHTSSGTLDAVTLNYNSTGDEVVVEFGQTGAIQIPSGTTAQRPSSITPAAGMLRYNTSNGEAEIYDGTAWGALGGGAASGDITASALTMQGPGLLGTSDTSSTAAIKVMSVLTPLRLAGTTLDIAPATVDTTELADDSVTEAKIADGSITAAKLDPTLSLGGDPNWKVTTYSSQDYVVLDAADSSSTQTNVPVVVQRKGLDGSFMLTTPDGTDSLTGTGGGNARGTRCVDLSIYRRRNFDVCDGDNNFMAGGSPRIAGGTQNVVIGYRCQTENAATSQSTVIGVQSGMGNSGHANSGVIIGTLSTLSFQDCVAVGNQLSHWQNGTDGNNRPRSMVMIGNNGRPHSPGSITFNVGKFLSGTNQLYSLPSIKVLRAETTDSTATEMSVPVYGQNYLKGIQTQDESVTTFEVQINALSDARNYACWRRYLVAKRNADGSTISIVSTQTIGTDVGSNSGAVPSGWQISFTADTAAGADYGKVHIQVQGPAATNIRWIARVEVLELQYDYA